MKLKFKHFETESGKTTMTAQFDGYGIAERLLEGLMFQITIVNGELKASIKPEDESYFSQFNTDKFLKEAEDYAEICDGFNDPVSNEDCWLVTDVDNRVSHPFQEEVKEEVKEIIIGDFKPKRKFLTFVSDVNGVKVRLLRDIAFLKGEKLSGTLEGVIFKLTICDEGTIKFEEEGTTQTDKLQRQRLLDDIDSMNVTGYAQKFVVNGLQFTDINGDICYIEVEHQKPIDKLRSLFSEEKVEDVKISQKGLSALDMLFGDSEVDLSEEEVEIIIETNENPPEPNDNLKEAGKKYMEEQFQKMNEEKVTELKKRVGDKEDEVKGYKKDISFAESKLKETEGQLGVLESRLESMSHGDEPNGYVFFVSEEQKNDIELDEKTKEVTSKIASLMKLKEKVLLEYLTGGFYKIKITDKSDIESTETKFDKELLLKVNSIDVSGKMTITGNGEFEYRGELNWHQLVSKMIRKGFEQDPLYDKQCNSNSYEIPRH